MCGITGLSYKKGLTDTQKRTAMQKLKVIAFMNEGRGGDGIGMWLNNEIVKGWNDVPNKVDTKKFEDFIAHNYKNMLPLPEEDGGTVMIHTRKSTVGSVSKDNNHPFYIEGETPEDDIIFCHNGSLQNHWALCNKHGVNHTKIHVDSLALGVLLNKVGYSILEEYVGYAALLWTKPSEPGSLFVYHGASKEKHADRFTWEERPLHFLETEEGIYFSSLIEPLQAIIDAEDQEPKVLEYNAVFKVNCGEWVTDFKYDIYRDEMNIKKTTAYANTNTNWNYSVGSNTNTNKSVTSSFADPKESVIWRETKPGRVDSTYGKEMVYFHKGRYWTPEGKLCQGMYMLDKRGRICNTDRGTKTKYFWRGVMLINEGAYNKIMTLKDKGTFPWTLDHKTTSFAFYVSEYAMYPVTNLEDEYMNAQDGWFRYGWHKGGKRCVSDSFSPLFASRRYVIKDGFLTNIQSSISKTEKVLMDRAEYDAVIAAGKVTQGLLIGLPSGAVIDKDSPIEGFPKTKEEPKEDIFDTVYDTADDVLEYLSKDELEACIEYCIAEVKAGSDIDIDYDEAQNLFWESICRGVTARETIRQSLGDTTYSLEYYLAMIQNNIREDDELPINVEDPVEKQERIDKLIEDIQKERAEDKVEEINLNIEDAISMLQDLGDRAEECSVIGTDYGDEVADVINKGVDNIKHGLVEACEKVKQEGLIKKINSKISSVI